MRVRVRVRACVCTYLDVSTAYANQNSLCRFFAEVFGTHLGISDKKLDAPSDNVTLWHVFKTITARPSAKHVSMCYTF